MLTELDRPSCRNVQPEAWLSAFDAQDREAANADKLTEAELDAAIVYRRDFTDSQFEGDSTWDRHGGIGASLTHAEVWRDAIYAGALVALVVLIVVGVTW
jgi:N-acyl-D-aspartate/D-glutamate deacylase